MTYKQNLVVTKGYDQSKTLTVLELSRDRRRCLTDVCIH